MAAVLFTTLLCALVWGTQSQSQGSSPPTVARLSAALTSGLYSNANIPPSYNGPVDVTISLNPIKLLDVDVEKGVVTMTVWSFRFWNDPRLMWNKSDFDGVDRIHFDIDKIWSPDLVPFNLAAPMEQLSPALALVLDTGKVTYVPAYKLSFHCDLDGLESEQGTNCSLKIGSWTYDGNILNLKVNTDVDMSNFVANSKVEVVSASTVRSVQYYSCCPEPYVDVTFSFVLRKIRRSGLFGW